MQPYMFEPETEEEADIEETDDLVDRTAGT